MLLRGEGGVLSARFRASSRALSFSDFFLVFFMSLDEYTYWLAPTDDHLRAIGRVIVESATLESVIEIAIWQLLKLPVEIGEQITNRPNLGQLTKILLCILPRVFKKDDDKKAFEPIEKELKTIVGIRNHLAHAYWAFGTQKNSPISMSYRSENGEIIPRTKKWRADEIERIAARIATVGNEFIYYLTARGVETPPSPSRPWRQYQVAPEPKWPRRKGAAPPIRRRPSQK